jgi:sugar phosphate isomerase/epimerase
VLVFGSPRNWARGGSSPAQADAIAIPFFRNLGRAARASQVTFCIEPNPAAYGCDYVTRAVEGLDLVRAVDDPGFGLHLDAAAMTLSADPPDEVFRQASRDWRHFHVSEPNLGPVGGGMDHRPIADALCRSGYRNWISIEMKASDEGFQLAQLESAIHFVRAEYLSGVHSQEESCTVA